MPPQISCASAPPGKTGKREKSYFHSNAALVESTVAKVVKLPVIYVGDKLPVTYR